MTVSNALISQKKKTVDNYVKSEGINERLFGVYADFQFICTHTHLLVAVAEVSYCCAPNILHILLLYSKHNKAHICMYVSKLECSAKISIIVLLCLCCCACVVVRDYLVVLQMAYVD